MVEKVLFANCILHLVDATIGHHPKFLVFQPILEPG